MSLRLYLHGFESINVHLIHCQFLGDRNVGKLGSFLLKKSFWVISKGDLGVQSFLWWIYRGVIMKPPKCRLKSGEGYFTVWINEWTRRPHLTPPHPLAWACLLSCFSHVRLCDPVDCSPPGFSAHGILQARILEWVATSSSRGSFWIRDGTHISYISCIGRQILHHEPSERPPSPPPWRNWVYRTGGIIQCFD